MHVFRMKLLLLETTRDKGSEKRKIICNSAHNTCVDTKGVILYTTYDKGCEKRKK